MGREERIYVGRAVDGGKIRFLSVSQIKLFDPESEGCWRKWAYAYVFGKKLAKTDAQTGGTDYASKLEHYLKTGEDVLPPVLQPAKSYFPVPGSDLEVERPLGIDFPAAVFLREAMLKPEHAVARDKIMVEMERLAGLVAHGIPLEGAADFRHRRGEFVNEDGMLQRERFDTQVAEVGDLKTTSRIWPVKIKSGQNAGKVLPGYAKTSAQVCEDAQMVGYAKHAVDLYPGLTHVRLSHVYAQTSSKGATKRTGLISVAQILDRWQGVERVVDDMVQVATAQRIEDIRPTPSSCDAFTHVGPDGKTTKGCGHRYYCPLSNSTVVSHMLGPYKEASMSLFDSVPPPPASPAPVAPAPPVDNRAAVEAHKQQLMREDAARVATPSAPTVQSFGFCSRCGTVLSATNASRLQDGAYKHVGCPQAQPVAPQAPFAVTPADAPPPVGIIEAADPLPASALAEITDPALRKQVEDHAAEHKKIEEEKARKEAEVKAAEGAAVWCRMSGQRITVTTEMALARKYTCECTKPIGLKPAKQADGTFQATLPRHKPVKKLDAPAAQPQAQTAEDDDELDEFIAPEPTTAPPPPPTAQPLAATPPPPPPPPAAPTPPAPSAPTSAIEAHVNGNGINGNGHSHAHVNGNVFPAPQASLEVSAISLLRSIDEQLREGFRELIALVKGRQA